MVLQSYGRNISYLRLSITDKCNLRCRYCMPEQGLPSKGHNQLLRVEEMARLLRLFRALGINKLRITGGEPLVSRRLYPLLEAAMPLGFSDISLTTNGQLLAQEAAKLKAAGVQRLNISLDTLQPERFAWISRGGNLADTLNGIDAALAANFNPVKVNCVVVRGYNDDDIEAIANLAKDKPLGVRFIEFMPIGEDSLWDESNFFSLNQAKERIAKLGKLMPCKLPGSGPAEVYQIDGFRGSVGFIAAISGHLCPNCNRLRLTSDGKLYPCLHSDLYLDLLEPIRAEASDAELELLIRQAVGQKPLQHEKWGSQKRDMNRLGG